MEKKERVLAYSMAKVIDSSELSDVSGGSNWSHHNTVRASGSTGAMDVFVDVSVDC